MMFAHRTFALAVVALALTLVVCLTVACPPQNDAQYVMVPDEEGLPKESAPTLPAPLAPDEIARGIDEPPPVDVEPEPVDPEPVEPEPVDPEPVDPEPVDPAPVDPAPAVEDVTIACSHVQVVDTGGLSVNVRPTASTAQGPVGTLLIGDVVDVVEVVDGQAIERVGSTDTTTTWVRVIGADVAGFVSGAFLTCAIDAVDAPPACPRVRVVDTGGSGANVRPTPSTSQAAVGVLGADAVADVLSVVAGQDVGGTTTWFEIEREGVTGFVTGAFLSCDVGSAHPPSVFLLPLPCGMTVTVTQGNNTNFSHNGASAYSFDFGIPSGTPLLAIKDAVVIAVDESTQPGDPCYSGGGQSCINEANGVTLRHPDGTTSLYAHVNSVDVSLGQSVARGQRVATSGGTGWSTGPHAHLQRQGDCGFAFCQSIPMSFGDVGGDGVPVSGDVVTSENGCF